MRMNREIKFRGWERELQMMVYDTELGGWHFEYDGNPVRAVNQMINEEDYFYDLMQYTGLKDKNGADIYEGDILSTDLDRPYLIVEFRNGAFMFQCHDNGKDYYDFMAITGENSNFTKYHEVIGNIYENRKLLGRDGE